MIRRYWPYILCFIYFIFPFDLIPDFVPGIGWIDDLLLLVITYFFRLQQGGEFHTSGSKYYSNTGDRADSGFNRRYSNEQAKSRSREQEEKKSDPYHILGLKRPASREEIARAYRIKASQYHPDKVSHLGEELQDLANRKFREIQRAYEQLQSSAL